MIFSCSLGSKNINNKNIKKDLYLYTMTHDIGQDSILVKALVAFPNSNLVFVKKNDKFEALVESTLRIENNETELQIERISDTNKILKEYYEDTRSSELHQIEYLFLLKKDNYKITLSIKDLDSFNIWNLSKNIEPSNKETTLFFYYDNENKKYSLDGIVPITDTLWVEIPKYQFDINNYEYNIMNNDISNNYLMQNCVNKGVKLKETLSLKNSDNFQDFLLPFKCY